MKRISKRTKRYDEGGETLGEDVSSTRQMMDAPGVGSADSEFADYSGQGSLPEIPSRSVARDIAKIIEEAKRLAPGAENLRYRDKMLGYEVPVGKDQSITPYLGKGQVGVTYTVRGLKQGGEVKKTASSGKVSSASKRGDGIAQRGKTRGRMV